MALDGNGEMREVVNVGRGRSGGGGGAVEGERDGCGLIDWELDTSGWKRRRVGMSELYQTRQRCVVLVERCVSRTERARDLVS